MNPKLNTTFISRTRRNHGLEHATIHVLSSANPRRPIAGHSDSGGFWILGEVPTEELAEAVIQALTRLRNGEQQLAVHPNCGTNYATYGTAAGLGAFIAMTGAGRSWRQRLERLPLVALFSTLALIAAQPLALRIQQRVTTSGDPQGLEIVEIRKSQVAGKTTHRVATRG